MSSCARLKPSDSSLPSPLLPAFLDGRGSEAIEASRSRLESLGPPGFLDELGDLLFRRQRSAAQEERRGPEAAGGQVGGQVGGRLQDGGRQAIPQLVHGLCRGGVAEVTG